jgi:nickel-dependent lactate racemase
VPSTASTLALVESERDAGIDRAALEDFVAQVVRAVAGARRVLLVPPDFTRRHSGSGELTVLFYRALSAQAHVELLPALGTHAALTATERSLLFPGIPEQAFFTHDFRNDVTLVGEVPSALVHAVSGGRVAFPIRCELATRLVRGGWDRILSIGQVVPHEVAGMAGHAKNVFIGLGGKDAIDRTHFVGAVCGLESAMGLADTPVRRLLDFMAGELGRALPLTYVLTVRAQDAQGVVRTRGLFAGDDNACFERAVSLSQALNIELLDEAPQKVVAYLEPDEFRSTWLGNKAVYRTRLAVADGGELLILAPGVGCFSSDAGIDALVRRHGYRGTESTLRAVESDPELGASLAAAAHLIHGSSEGRFRVRYATGGLASAVIERAGYEAADLGAELARYDPARLSDGWHTLPKGERIFFVSRPALGLWSERTRFVARSRS